MITPVRVTVGTDLIPNRDYYQITVGDNWHLSHTYVEFASAPAIGDELGLSVDTLAGTTVYEIVGMQFTGLAVIPTEVAVTTLYVKYLRQDY